MTAASEPPPADGADEDDPSERTEHLALPAGTTRLVVLGDPHGDLIGLELALEREARPDTAIVSAGDNIGYADGVVSSFMCQVMASRGIRSVFGNHEDWSRGGRLFLGAPGGENGLTPEALAWCRALPYRLAIRPEARPDLRLHVVHTLPEWAYVKTDSAGRLLDLEPEARVVCCGHSHKPAIYALRQGLRRPKVHRLDPLSSKPLEVPLAPDTRYVVDAGSLARPARPRFGMCLERATYAVVDLGREVLSLVSIDKAPRLQALIEELTRRPRPEGP